MRLRDDLLSPVLTVPYVPTLGAVHPAEHTAAQFKAVIAASGTGRFLPHDPGSRWTDSQAEVVLVEHILHEAGRTMIPTLHKGRGALKVHHYGPSEPDLGLAAKLGAEYGAESVRVLWFGQSPDHDGTRLLMASFDKPIVASGTEVKLLDALSSGLRATFADFAAAMAGEGFAFLCNEITAGRVTSPVLVVVDGVRIVGAIGPMDILADSAGRRRLLPQYLAVLPEYRGRGYGRDLWRAASAWAKTTGASYQIMQARRGGPSEHMFLSEGLHTLGFIFTSTL